MLGSRRMQKAVDFGQDQEYFSRVVSQQRTRSRLAIGDVLHMFLEGVYLSSRLSTRINEFLHVSAAPTSDGYSDLQCFQWPSLAR